MPPAAPAAEEGPIDRGEFLREGAQVLGAVGTRLSALLFGGVVERIAPELMRPPGALADEGAFLAACTRCGECAQACHQESILIADARRGLSFNTPYLDVMGHNPCFLCTKPPCIEACPSGALLPTLAEDFRMGTVRILAEHCLAHAGEPCARCVERCPYRGSAIRTDEAGLPVVDASRCTGCGLCYPVCPTSPKALVIEPSRS